jgi:putative DNA primase/helicase
VSAKTAGAPPRTLAVIDENIPTDLTERPQWVGWQWVWIPDDARWTKVPLDAKTGRRASSTNPATWATFAAALAAAERRGWPGVGFVVTRDDPYVGIDLDDCLDPETGELAPWAAAIIADFDSYTEVTPSATGLRIWIRTETGLLPGGEDGRREGPIEAYGAARYFTVTGHRLARRAR